MLEEIKVHTENKYWEVIERAEMPKGYKILPSVWAMRKKSALPLVKCTHRRQR